MNSRSMSFIIKTVNKCNLSCDYCYAPRFGEEKYFTFPLEYLEKIIQGSIELGIKNVQFVWHGNEPTLAGLPYFKKIVELQKQQFESWQCFSNVMQTNATLLNESWLVFFRENNFGVGVSLDGPTHIHDHNRKTVNAKGTHSKVESKYNKLRKAGCDGGICAVISKHSLQYPNEIVEYFSSMNVPEYDLLPCYFAEVNELSRQSSVSSREFGEFMIKAFDRWLEIDNPNAQIRTFETIITLLIGGEAGFCQYRHDKCNDFLGVNTNGDVYPCDLFVADALWKLGSLSHQSLPDIMFSKKNREYYRRMISQDDECLNCQWLKVCWGGCTHHRYLRNKNITGNSEYCETRKMLFEHISQAIGTIPSSINKRALYKPQNRDEKDFSIPLYVDIGNACNSRCYFCAADSNKNFKLIGERFDPCLESAQKLKLNKIIISGGEATTLKDLPNFIAKSKEYGFTQVHLQTNGRLLSKPEKIQRLMKSGVTEFGISLHGHTKKIHDLITRTNGSFEQTIKFMENMNFLYGSNELPVTVNTVVTPENLPFLSDIAKLCIDYNITGLKFSYLHGIGRAKNLLNKDTWPFMTNITPHLEQVIKFVEYYGKNNTKLAIEAIPFCLLPGNEIYNSDLCIEEVYLAHSGKNTLTKYHSGMDRQKGVECKDCNFYSLCLGPWKEYIEKYGTMELKPIKYTHPKEIGIG